MVTYWSTFITGLQEVVKIALSKQIKVAKLIIISQVIENET
jgi:hypothetical protein